VDPNLGDRSRYSLTAVSARGGSALLFGNRNHSYRAQFHGSTSAIHLAGAISSRQIRPIPYSVQRSHGYWWQKDGRFCPGLIDSFNIWWQPRRAIPRSGCSISLGATSLHAPFGLSWWMLMLFVPKRGPPLAGRAASERERALS